GGSGVRADGGVALFDQCEVLTRGRTSVDRWGRPSACVAIGSSEIRCYDLMEQVAQLRRSLAAERGLELGLRLGPALEGDAEARDAGFRQAQLLAAAVRAAPPPRFALLP